MTVFDPDAMTAPLASRAASLTGSNGIKPPAVIVEAIRGDRSAKIVLGVDDVDTEVAARTNQTFEVGSHTKMMTAVAVLQLVGEGRIDLDARAADYLPSSVVSGLPNASTATVRQLLAMRSGIPNYNDDLDIAEWLDAHPGQSFGPSQALAVARDMDATNAPGAAFHYANTPYLLLGMIIEEVTGHSWASEIQSRVFDRAGMSHSSARQFDPDPQRLSSYRVDGGRLVDVTNGLWVPKGESGVVSTTSDLIAFLSALLREQTLLSPAMLDEMLGFVNTGGGNAFGLGIFRYPVSGRDLYGFAGGTLGTASATWFDPTADIFVSMGASLSSVPASAAATALQTTLRALEAWAQPDGGPVEVRSVSAAALGIADHSAGATISARGAALTLDTSLRGLALGDTVFSDGSVLVVGDGTSGTGGDERGNLVSIPLGFAGAMNADNRLYGFGGSDDMTGGNGDDRISGGAGSDTMHGGAGNDYILGGSGNNRMAGEEGNDRIGGGANAELAWGNAGHDYISLGDGADDLYGGPGDDTLRGGSGRDHLYGGDGADKLEGGRDRDVFVFDDGESTPGAPDVITDFSEHGDYLDFRPVDAVDGGGDSRFHWIGRTSFTDHAGELRITRDGDDFRIEGDTDGDGRAEVAVVLRDYDGGSPDHLLL